MISHHAPLHDSRGGKGKAPPFPPWREIRLGASIRHGRVAPTTWSSMEGIFNQPDLQAFLRVQ